MKNDIKANDLSKILLASYAVPFVGDDFRINLYLYGKTDEPDILFSKYYEEIPKDILAGNPSLSDMEKWCLEMDNEYAVFINGDVCPQTERTCVLEECLFHLAHRISDCMESEEFAARVIGDAFKTMAPLLDPELSSAVASKKRGLSISEFPIPLVQEGYRVTLNMFDEATAHDTMMKLRDFYKAKMLSGEFHPMNNHGFVAEPGPDELGVFVNCGSAPDLLSQQVILAHELFHAAKKINRMFNDSAELGARIYRMLFRQFSMEMTSGEENQDIHARSQESRCIKTGRIFRIA